VVTRTVALLRQRRSDSAALTATEVAQHAPPARPGGLTSPSGRRVGAIRGVACSPRHRPLIPGAGQRRVRGSRPARAGTDPGQSCDPGGSGGSYPRGLPAMARAGGGARGPGECSRYPACVVPGARGDCASAGLPDCAPAGRFPGKGWTGRSQREVSRAGQEARRWPRPGQPRRNPPSRGLAVDSAADGAVLMARTVTVAVSGRGLRGPP